MKLLIFALVLAACVDASPPTESSSSQGMMRQPGGTIEVHDCGPGEIGDGDFCFNPILNLPADEGPSRGYGEHGGGYGGGGCVFCSHDGYGGMDTGYTFLDRQELVPGVMLYEFSFKSAICKFLCATYGAAICVAANSACAIGSTFTLGGVTLPCAAVVIAACAAGGEWTNSCKEVVCK